mmetsp:Transcript_65666/g.129169  ORF Transcript_65666/g.129169 Transcript_65666/m.129169 type:complete len:204 (-) Transcript_65666:64-675(-)
MEATWETTSTSPVSFRRTLNKSLYTSFVTLKYSSTWSSHWFEAPPKIRCENIRNKNSFRSCSENVSYKSLSSQRITSRIKFTIGTPSRSSSMRPRMWPDFPMAPQSSNLLKKLMLTVFVDSRSQLTRTLSGLMIRRPGVNCDKAPMTTLDLKKSSNMDGNTSGVTGCSTRKVAMAMSGPKPHLSNKGWIVSEPKEPKRASANQ